MIGEILGGKYRVLELLGEGGMGSVFVAEQTNLGRKVALKVLRRGLQDTSGLAQRFLAEARMVAGIADPNIVQVFDVGVAEDGRLYLAMELLVGESLDAFMRMRGKLGLAESVAIANDIATALSSAHEASIIHRDLKPSNVFLVEAPHAPLGARVKVLDFGVAKMIEATANMAPVTATGNVFGTPHYMSPEQIHGDRQIDARTDVYALGGLLFEMLCGRRPFDEPSPAALLRAQLFDPPPDPRSFEPSIPEQLSALIVQMLAKDRTKRPESMVLVSAALAAIALPQARVDLRRSASAAASSSGQIPTSSGAITGGGQGLAGVVTGVPLKPPPTSFFGSTLAGTLLYFKNEDVRLDKIKETFAFYRDHLNDEYNELSRQMRTAHSLWLACVGLGFAMLLLGLGVLLIADRTKVGAGVATSLSSALVYFIVRVLQKREDHYRELRAEKNRNLEYGNDWLLLIQSIDAMGDPTAKMTHQKRLVAVLTEKLEHARANVNTRTEAAVALPRKRVARARQGSAKG